MSQRYFDPSRHLHTPPDRQTPYFTHFLRIRAAEDHLNPLDDPGGRRSVLTFLHFVLECFFSIIRHSNRSHEH